jgi:hypothetical protein
MPRTTRRQRRDLDQTAELEAIASQIPTRNSSPLLDRRDTEQVMEELVERLTQVGRPKDKFKPPKYTGDTDVELFIDRFLDIADANNWRPRETTLHLKGCLEGTATDCSRGSNVEEIIESLRSRFGITARQARVKLSQLQKRSKQSYHELGSEVSRLVKIAYPGQNRDFITETSLEVFSRALCHKSLQQHLLARPHDTLPESIKICDEFSQLETTTKTPVSHIDTTETVPPPDPTTSHLQVLLTAIQELTQSQAKLMASLAQNNKPKQKIECFVCKGPHLKRNCPHNQVVKTPATVTPNDIPVSTPVQPVTQPSQSGNFQCPAQ